MFPCSYSFAERLGLFSAHFSHIFRRHVPMCCIAARIWNCISWVGPKKTAGCKPSIDKLINRAAVRRRGTLPLRFRFQRPTFPCLCNDLKVLLKALKLCTFASKQDASWEQWYHVLLNDAWCSLLHIFKTFLKSVKEGEQKSIDKLNELYDIWSHQMRNRRAGMFFMVWRPKRQSKNKAAAMDLLWVQTVLCVQRMDEEIHLFQAEHGRDMFQEVAFSMVLLSIHALIVIAPWSFTKKGKYGRCLLTIKLSVLPWMISKKNEECVDCKRSWVLH